jgi:hypothetical protein
MLFEALRVTVEIDPATVLGMVNAVAVVLEKLSLFEQANFIPVPVQEKPGAGARQPVDA